MIFAESGQKEIECFNLRVGVVNIYLYSVVLFDEMQARVCKVIRHDNKVKYHRLVCVVSYIDWFYICRLLASYSYYSMFIYTWHHSDINCYHHQHDQSED